MTQVKFYNELGNNTLAVFPEIIHSFNGYRKDNITCYSHIWQHSACSPDYLKGKRLALYGSYWPLLLELIGQGYNDLKVLNLKRETKECHRQPTQSEIKRGYGATHYRTFTLAEIGLNKRGMIKSWFVAPDDNLRYYTR